MRQFIFPTNEYWALADSTELAGGVLENGGIGLFLFTDEDLATTFAKDAGLVGKAAKSVQGGNGFLHLLLTAKQSGFTHLVIDPATVGKEAHATEIDKAINDVLKHRTE